MTQSVYEMPKLPSMPRLGRPSGMRVPRRPTVLPQGPRLYQQTRANVVHMGGPMLAPPGFKVASTSASEWMFYWASMKVLDPKKDPRKPPFVGGEYWLYQSSELGAFVRQKGSAVVDFFYKSQYPYLAVRIQTYRFHLAAPSLKQAYDRNQLLALAGYFDVIDVFEGDFIGDPSGVASILAVKRALGLIQTINPLRTGNVYLVRNALTTQR